MKKAYEILIVSLLLGFIAVSVLDFMKIKSPVCDEVAHHIASGYSYVKTGDYRMNPSTPALIRSFIGLPLLSMDLSLPLDDASWQTNDSPVFGKLFLYRYNTDPERILFFARLPALFLSIMMALLVYLWARELYGSASALLALFLYAFLPHILGNSGLAMIDIGGSFFMLLGMFTFWKFLLKDDIGHVILCGAAFGLAQSAKHSAVILLPVFLMIGLADAAYLSKSARGVLRRTGQLLAIFAVGAVVLWATYSFEFKPLLRNAPDVEEKAGYISKAVDKMPVGDKDKMKELALRFAREVPIPLSSFLVSLAGVSKQVLVSGQRIFFMGNYYPEGFPAYSLLLFLVRTPVPLLLMILFSAVFSLLHKRSKPAGRADVCLITFAAVFFLSVSFSKLQGGIRYLLPVYPFIFIWVSDTLNVKFGPGKGRAAKYSVLSFIIVWYAAGTMSVSPHYLSYFNEFAAGPGGSAHKVSHDMDWGQDLELLAGYLKKNGVEEVTLSYFGTADPAAYGMNYTGMTPEEERKPGPKVYAISVRYLDSTAWALEKEPTARAGYSIFIYDLRDKERVDQDMNREGH